MKQVQETGLFRHVAAFLSSANSCCRNLPPLGFEDNLPNIAATVCCQGAEIWAGKYGSLNGYCCRETCVKCLKANGDKAVTVVSGTVVNGKCEQGVDILVPSSQTKQSCPCSASSNYIGMLPASNDVLTALLLALPPETWSGIKDKKLLQEISSLVSTEKLPTLVQEEVTNSCRNFIYWCAFKFSLLLQIWFRYLSKWFVYKKCCCMCSLSCHLKSKYVFHIYMLINILRTKGNMHFVLENVEQV